MAGNVNGGTWANRFIMVAILIGAITFVVFALLLLLQLLGEPISRALASGGIATWLLVGGVGLMILTVAIATTALFYQHIEVTMGKPYTGIKNILAWLHLALLAIGGLVASLMFTYVGYAGGVGGVASELGGGGLNPGQIHEIAAPFVNPIGYALGVAALGTLLGGIGYGLSWLSKR
ncbi:MAG: hypothetical protein LN412_06565 [Candidatus Thermoplasmatota archaeon]|nr:hypothetical protein [Candidatus Thermoplasmatota archaeon]